jgi:diketogulonate reductase-like aldo/keto reductase
LPLIVGRIYGNEHEVGQGIKDSGVLRGDIFITGKLWNTDHPNAEEGLQKTLKALDTDYLDLYVSISPYALSLFFTNIDRQLIHWPVRLVPVSIITLKADQTPCANMPIERNKPAPADKP